MSALGYLTSKITFFGAVINLPSDVVKFLTLKIVEAYPTPVF